MKRLQSVDVLAVNVRDAEVGLLPRHAALDALPQVLLAGGDVALKDVVQRDAAEAQADDLIGHLQTDAQCHRLVVSAADSRLYLHPKSHPEQTISQRCSSSSSSSFSLSLLAVTVFHCDAPEML